MDLFTDEENINPYVDEEFYAEQDQYEDEELPESIIEDEDDRNPKETMLNRLRGVLRYGEVSRESFRFIYKDDEYLGVPMAEINPDKFVFKIVDTGRMMSVVLSDVYWLR